MRISELVRKLNAARKREGDVEVEGVDGNIVSRVEVVTGMKVKLVTQPNTDLRMALGSSTLGNPRS